MEEAKDIKEFLQFDPRPQRVLRLNRRGFYLSGHNKKNASAFDDSNIQKVDGSSISQCAISKLSLQDTTSTSSSGSKIIKLKNSVSETDNCLKRTLNGNKNLTSDTNCQKKSDQETPPRKKHKPITWP